MLNAAVEDTSLKDSAQFHLPIKKIGIHFITDDAFIKRGQNKTSLLLDKCATLSKCDTLVLIVISDLHVLKKS
jgi:hypothetical protein